MERCANLHAIDIKSEVQLPHISACIDESVCMILHCHTGSVVEIFDSPMTQDFAQRLTSQMPDLTGTVDLP